MLHADGGGDLGFRRGHVRPLVSCPGRSRLDVGRHLLVGDVGSDQGQLHDLLGDVPVDGLGQAVLERRLTDGPDDCLGPLRRRVAPPRRRRRDRSISVDEPMMSATVRTISSIVVSRPLPRLSTSPVPSSRSASFGIAAVVSFEDEVAGLLAVAFDDGRLAAHDPPNGQQDPAAKALSFWRTVVVERADGDGVDAEHAHVRPRPDRPRPCPRLCRLGQQGMLLVHGHVLRGAVDLGARKMHQPAVGAGP